jgi:hypothetical protein
VNSAHLLLGFDEGNLPQLIAVLVVALISGIGSLLNKKKGDAEQAEDPLETILREQLPRESQQPETPQRSSSPRQRRPKPQPVSPSEHVRQLAEAAKAHTSQLSRRKSSNMRRPIESSSDKVASKPKQARSRLPAKTALRDAIVWSEILQPPLALRENPW